MMFLYGYEFKHKAQIMAIMKRLNLSIKKKYSVVKITLKSYNMPNLDLIFREWTAVFSTFKSMTFLV